MTIYEAEDLDEIKSNTNVVIKKMCKLLKGKGIVIQYHVPGEPWERGSDSQDVNISINDVSDYNLNNTVCYSEKFGCVFKELKTPIPPIIEDLVVNVVDEMIIQDSTEDSSGQRSLLDF